MSIKNEKQSRRQFLVGAGKTAILLPFLPSLLPDQSLAQATVAQKRIAFFTLGHCMPASKFLSPNLATTTVGVDGARDAILSGLGPISPALNHANILSLQSRGMISVVRGLDNIIHQNGHGSQILSGSSERVDEYNPLPFPSIDTIMEASPTLYPGTTPTTVRKVIRCDNGDLLSSYKKVGSNIVHVPGYPDPIAMYNDLFSALTEPGAPTPAPDSTMTIRSTILNNIFSSFQTVRNSRKISSEDKTRLDEHLGLLNELQKKFNSNIVTVPILNTCTKPTRPVWNGSYTQLNQINLQLMALAMKCGVSKVGLVDFAGHGMYGIPGLPTNFSLHNGIFHNVEGANYSSSQINDFYVVWMKWHIDQIATNFLNILDVEEPGTNRTYLDNMMSVVLSEGGVDTEPGTHSNLDYQPIIFGTMGGYLKGNRFTVLPTKTETVYERVYKYRLPYNCLLITFLEAMKIPVSEYAQYNGGSGYGIYRGGPTGSIELTSYVNFFGSRFTKPITEILS